MNCFTPYFDRLAPEIGQVPTLVFGAIWRYCQMSDNVCKATLQTLANRLSVNRLTIIRAIRVLVTAGLIVDLTPDLRNRPHIYRLTEVAQTLVNTSAVSESDTEPEVSVSESDRTGAPEPSAVTESDGGSQPELPPAVTGLPARDARGIPPRTFLLVRRKSVRRSEGLSVRRTLSCRTLLKRGHMARFTGGSLNQTLLRNKLRDKDKDMDLEEFYRSKVNYINGQQLAFLNIRPIMYCDFHSFDGQVFRISHPDPYFVVRLNATLRSTYHKTLTLWIDPPDFQVEFIHRMRPA
ncbi:MAG: helix-turn-helix domain-containing protein [Anaerolineaceae bacterium]|nr:helix-turn-helix domain-containing protein [Anaerolineaceae bacterium]MBN2678370.1 helix-turn-helix domain-containing protein [Anaerolineaceae bacterium]